MSLDTADFPLMDLVQSYNVAKQVADLTEGTFISKADRAVEELIYKRKFSIKTRRSLAANNEALPDGSYPIPDKDALRRAAILARSSHGNVAAAKKLIARRAAALKVPNPLTKGASGGKGQGR